MISELVSFEQAKSLKEIGFPQKIIDGCYLNEGYHDDMYDLDTGDLVYFKNDIRSEWVEDFGRITKDILIVAPEIERVAKWLREEKYYAIVVESSTKDNHTFWINNIEYFSLESEYVSPNVYATFEDALKAGIDIVIEKLKENKES